MLGKKVLVRNMRDKENIENVINKSIEKLSCVKTLTVDEKGHFNLKLSATDKQIVVSHGWDRNSNTFVPSNVVDVMLNDLHLEKTYYTYITEFQPSSLPGVLHEIVVVATMFFNEEFKIVRGKNEYLRFDNQDIRYSEYSLAGKYIPQ